MQDETTDAHAEIDRPLTAPETLLDRETSSSEHIRREQDQSHFDTRRELTGYAIVGITNEDGEVLFESYSDGDRWRIPYARVEPDDDYISTARREVEKQLDVDLDIDRVVHVRRFDALLEESPAAELAADTENPGDLTTVDGYAESYDVLLEATPESSIPASTRDADGESDSTLEWFDSIPEGAPRGLPGEDIRRFIS